MPDPYVNRFGRKQSRGIRPWLLLPKVLSVAAAVGGMAATFAVWMINDPGTLPAGDPRIEWTCRTVSILLRGLVIPALLAAIGFGVGLTMQHPGILLGRRWLQAKLVLLILFTPAAHFYLSAQLNAVRRISALGGDLSAPARGFSIGLALTLALLCLLALLGRHKPRLGQ